MATEKDSSTDVESPVEQPSFNGKLEKFSFDTTADPGPARRSPRLSKGEETTSGADAKLASPLPKRKAADIRSFLVGGGTTPSQSSTPTSPRKKAKTVPKGKKPPGYAPPEKYAHLKLLPDTLEEGLICAFVGLNPGIMTAAMGHA